MSRHLTPAQHQAYLNDGFLFPIGVLSEAEADEHHRRLLAVEGEHGPMHYRVKPYLILRSAFEIATHPMLLDAVESVLGPDILLWDGSYVVKEPGSEGFVSWHQDLTYWGLDMRCDDDLVTAWVALTPANIDNGCMRFANGSHKGKRFEHEDTHDRNNILHRGQSIQENFDDRPITQIELSPGQASLHHGWAVHSSNPNTSDARRVALTLNYIKPDVQQIVGDRESATLVRGVDNWQHYGPEPACASEFTQDNVAFQLEMERKKREVYDTA